MRPVLGKDEKNKPPRLVPGINVRAGQVLAGKYRVEELLGSGASSLVVSAMHVHTRKPATLKILTAFTGEQSAAVDAQIKKARKASRLRNEHVARIVEIGTTEDGMRFIATEGLKGPTLGHELDVRERIPADEAVRWILQACEALAEAHAIGIVHGNLKPKNLLLSLPPEKKPRRGEPVSPTSAEERILKVLDFGMASPIEAIGDASASAWFGSPAYLSPEQIKSVGAIDNRADIWALGVILYEMIAGTIPFTAETVSGMLVSVVMDTPAMLTDAPYELARLVGKCLAKEPDDRFANVEELAAELVPFAGEAGARLSERVKIAACTPPPSDPLAIDPDDSIAPVSIDSRPFMLSQRRRSDSKTSPSRRVEAHRKKRLQQVVMTSAAAATAIVIAAALSLTSEDEPGITQTTSATVNTAEPATTDLRLRATAAAGIPRVVPRASSAPAIAELDAPDADTEQVTSPHALPAAPPPAPPPQRWQPQAKAPPPPPPPPPAASRLPKDLPSTRDPVATNAKKTRTPDLPPPSKRNDAPPASLPPRADESYFRQLFNERK